MMDLFPIILSLKCALVSALLVVPWGIFWGWVLARKGFTGKRLLQVVLFIPLVLPPVLTGFLLLILFSREGVLGHWLWETVRIRIIFDWKGIVLASSVVASPFMVQAVRDAVEAVDRRLEWAALQLGASPWKVFRTVTLPLIWPGIVSGFLLAFARSLGEFGASLMVAGNIPGKTQTMPLAIYGEVLLGHEGRVWPLVIAAVVLAYAGLWLGQSVKDAGRCKGRE